MNINRLHYGFEIKENMNLLIRGIGDAGYD